ncbi:MAG TPA: class I SAM-dependent methyltransferase [Croceibacterium sp.]
MTASPGEADAMRRQWSAVDSFFADRLAPSDPVLDAVLAANVAAGLPPHDVSPLQGRFLEILVRMTGARRVLEIGTLGGYSSIWMARALPADGRLFTLEADSRHAAVARDNLAHAGVAERVELREGAALERSPCSCAKGASRSTSCSSTPTSRRIPNTSPSRSRSRARAA